VGGGIGGLTATVALRHMGVEAVAYERAPDIRQAQVGAGVFLWTNALRALEQVGLREPVQAAGSEVDYFEIRTAGQGRRLHDYQVAEMSRKGGAPTVGIARPDLHSALLSHLDDGALVLGAALASFEQDAEGVTARFADGREERADVLIGADGARSIVRRELLGEIPLRYAGYTAWRGIVQDQLDILPQGWTRMIWGRGASILVYRVGGERPYWLAFANAPEGGRDPEGGHKQAALDRFRGYYEPAEAVIEATDEGAINRTDIADLDWIGRWVDGRVALLGDAAHAITPNVGQGACQAMEDAVTLAKMLREHDDPREALLAYQERRLPRVHVIWKRSRFLSRVRGWENPVLCGVRDMLLRLFISRMDRRDHFKDITHTV
jgi:FAD-dependent urate hydroxylase